MAPVGDVAGSLATAGTGFFPPEIAVFSLFLLLTIILLGLCTDCGRHSFELRDSGEEADRTQSNLIRVGKLKETLTAKNPMINDIRKDEKGASQIVNVETMVGSPSPTTIVNNGYQGEVQNSIPNLHSLPTPISVVEVHKPLKSVPVYSVDSLEASLVSSPEPVEVTILGPVEASRYIPDVTGVKPVEPTDVSIVSRVEHVNHIPDAPVGFGNLKLLVRNSLEAEPILAPGCIPPHNELDTQVDAVMNVPGSLAAADALVVGSTIENILEPVEVSIVNQLPPECTPVVDSFVPVDAPIKNDMDQLNGPIAYDTDQLNVPVMNDINQLNFPVMNDINQLNVPVMNDIDQLNVPIVNDIDQLNVPIVNDIYQLNVLVMNDIDQLNVPIVNDTDQLDVPIVNDINQLNVPNMNDIDLLHVPILYDSNTLSFAIMKDLDLLDAPVEFSSNFISQLAGDSCGAGEDQGPSLRRKPQHIYELIGELIPNEASTKVDLVTPSYQTKPEVIEESAAQPNVDTSTVTEPVDLSLHCHDNHAEQVLQSLATDKEQITTFNGQGEVIDLTRTAEVEKSLGDIGWNPMYAKVSRDCPTPPPFPPPEDES